jgi:hypothetical protein
MALLVPLTALFAVVAAVMLALALRRIRKTNDKVLNLRIPSPAEMTAYLTSRAVEPNGCAQEKAGRSCECAPTIWFIAPTRSSQPQLAHAIEAGGS